MTITVASGISTHTSITVVDTNILAFQSLNLCITASFSLDDNLQCNNAISSLGNSSKIWQISACELTADCTSSIFSESSINGVTINTRCH
ncbi:hypothetical protein J6T66_02045 [bacterium]|nr:hypothetical protein [bacterium]